jgi:ADP-ribose pyrophosphatase YjhB (NUDIX family)
MRGFFIHAGNLASRARQAGRMYITEETIRRLEEQYGTPETAHFRQAMIKPEFDLVVRSMKKDRAHDVTMFIFNGPLLITIRKHMHPEGICRAPSGGLQPGEDFEEGTLREAYEETGAQIELQRYLLRAYVTFTHAGREIPWTSHVFTATHLSGELMPIDTKEIAEVRQVTLEELQGPIRERMLATGSGGLAYRVALTDKVVELLRRS